MAKKRLNKGKKLADTKTLAKAKHDF